MGKKKRSDIVKFPVRRGHTPERKLSEIIMELAVRIYKEPGEAVSLPTLQTAVLLASSAWNVSLGELALRNQHKEILKEFDWGGATPWAELLSNDTDQLIAGLVEFKKTHYPNDRRQIVVTETSSDGNVRVDWVDGNKPISARFGAHAPPVDQPIADKLIADMKRYAGRKVVNFKEVLAGQSAAKELQKSVASRVDLASYHPSHAAYVIAQNHVSVISEQLTALKQMKPFVDIVANAEDEYLPSGPPMSPLTLSYFTSWAFFDVCAGPARETIGSVAMKAGAAFGMHAELVRVIGLMQRSRMGVYVHEGSAGDLVVLRELVTGAMCRCVVPAGYRGRKGELWYARVLPPPFTGDTEHIVFTTPYLLLKPGLREWEAYFRRVLPDAPQATRLATYESHMKFGPKPRYWTEFVFEGYVNHREEVIFLAGLPDVEVSRPNSRVNS